MPRKLFLSFILLTSLYAHSQTVTGSWYGTADVMMQGAHSNYLTELVIKQKGEEVEGVFGYYFKDTYQSFFIRGKYDKKSRQVSIKNLRVLFYLSSGPDGIECPMNFQGTLLVSQVTSTLKGTFYTEEKYKYTCPELRVNLSMDYSERNQDSILSNITAGRKFWKPQQDDFIVTNPSGTETKTVTQDVTVNNSGNIEVETSAAAVQQLMDAYGKRKNTYGKDIVVESDSIRISFYDNGDVDGDSISVLLNNNPVLVKHELNSRAMNVYLALDSTKSVNEISMFADNLGKYPPNTALMIVSDGINKHEVYLSSSLTQNATVRLRRKK
jgi:hypothetical protein